MKHNKQNLDDSLQIGEKVQVGMEENNYLYPTLIEDVLEDGHLVISSPMYRGIIVPVHEGQALQLFFYRDNGRYCLPVRAEKAFMHKELRLLSLWPLSEPIKQQRRESFRLPINLEARIRAFEDTELQEEEKPPSKDEWETTFTHNLSETGVAIKSLQEYKFGDMVHLFMQLDNDAMKEQVELLGIVRQVEKTETPKGASYRLGIEFMPYEEKTRRTIAKFILKKQQIILKMKRNEEYN